MIILRNCCKFVQVGRLLQPPITKIACSYQEKQVTLCKYFVIIQQFVKICLNLFCLVIQDSWACVLPTASIIYCVIFFFIIFLDFYARLLLQFVLRVWVFPAFWYPSQIMLNSFIFFDNQTLHAISTLEHRTH